MGNNDQTPVITNTPQRRRRGLRLAMVGVVILMLAAAGVGYGVWEHRQHQHRLALAARPYSPQDVVGAVNAVNSGQPVGPYQTYYQAYVAGSVYAANGQYVNAYKAYQQALKLTTKPTAQLYVTLAQLAQQLRQPAAAKTYYGQATHAPGFSAYSSILQQEYEADAK
jgi:tetratricopeptide (TPR) repeat protein